MWQRIVWLLRARLAAQSEGSNVPIAALFMSGAVSAFVCAATRDAVGEYGYAFVALSTLLALVAPPLIGEFGAYLVHDEAADWVRALPVSPFELRAARALHVAVAALVLGASPSVVAALFAPSTMALTARVGLAFAGLGLALWMAAIAVWIVAACATRAEGLLVAIQTLIFAAVIVGVVLGLRFVHVLGAWTHAADGGWLAFPPSWFAAPFGEPSTATAAICASLGALAAIALAPSVARSRSSSKRSWLGSVLTPLAILVERSWVRRDERASFWLVVEALPRERDFVLRTYPLVGVPLAFLALGANEEPSTSHSALLALLLLAPVAYLPILLAHTAVSRSHRARWIQDTAPAERSALTNGAIKAVVVRFIAPLYALLFAIGIAQGYSASALRLTPIAFATAIFVTRCAWPMCVSDLPLSIAPEEVRVRGNWGNLMLTLGVAAAILAVLAALFVQSTVAATVVFALLAVTEIALDRNWRVIGGLRETRAGRAQSDS